MKSGIDINKKKSKVIKLVVKTRFFTFYFLLFTFLVFNSQLKTQISKLLLRGLLPPYGWRQRDLLDILWLFAEPFDDSGCLVARFSSTQLLFSTRWRLQSTHFWIELSGPVLLHSGPD